MRRLISTVIVLAVCSMSFAQERKDIVGFKTNLLSDVLSAVNIGVEIPVWRGLAVEISSVFPNWVDRKTNRFAMQMEMLEGQIRKYWQSTELKGWYTGLYAQYGKGCIQWNPKYGYRINEYDSYGLSLGYVSRISERFAIEFGIGIGYMKMQYDYYRVEVYDGEQCLASQRDWRKYYSIWPVPVKASVSVYYVLGRKER